MVAKPLFVLSGSRTPGMKAELVIPHGCRILGLHLEVSTGRCSTKVTQQTSGLPLVKDPCGKGIGA